MREYDHKTIEKRWQEEWEKREIYKTEDPSTRSGQQAKPKFYILDMFPYPSGEGLHVGHPKGYIATDIYSRMMRMKGNNILHPMGWDAFGLPAEQFAIKNKVHPREAVMKNVARYKEQLQMMGLDYDWSREINTTDPEYYKWTQWIFLQIFKKGLAYESNEPINWCPECQTGLANEDLEDGRCERCDTPVEKRPIRQWVLKITDYANRLLDDLDLLNKWPESVKQSQKNWIGRSEGIEIEFGIKDYELRIKVFTTRPDTLFGATYLVLAPEHKMVQELKEKIENWDEVNTYIEEVKNKPEFERIAEGREKTGVELKGVKAINPATGEEIPVWIADYVMAHYGSGAVMAVPAHDQRDFEFARKFNLPVKMVVCEKIGCPLLDQAYPEPGFLVDSGKFDGMDSEKAREKITEFVKGKKKTVYKLRDWVFSRQRYWGEPIPLIHCDKCGVVPVPEDQLPLELPDIEKYEPTGTGESPLANIDEWVNVLCPECGGGGKRETNTMPQWAGSCWYYLRYMDPQNDKVFTDKKKEKYFSPIDIYVGGTEHATRHLIYARFWHKILYDLKLVSTLEPFEEFHAPGLILAEDGRKMSKRWGNVVNPDDMIDRFGADSFRVYEMFMGPFGNAIAWNIDGLVGARRFIEKVWRMKEKAGNTNIDLEASLHKTAKKVGEDIHGFKFNTAISAMMIFANEVEKAGSIGEDQFKMFLQILAPFAPHMTEELWSELGENTSIHLSVWPAYDESKIKDENVSIVVQVNARVRTTIEASAGLSEEEVKDLAFKDKNIQKWTEGKEIKNLIYIPDKLLNIVV